MNTNAKLTIGMDLGDEITEVCAVDELSEIAWRKTLDSTPKAMCAFFSRFEKPAAIVVAMEAGTHSPWLSDLLIDLGFGVVVGNSRELRAIWGSNNKTDRHDAAKLARLARSDRKLLKPIQHRDHQSRLDLLLLKARDGLVKSRANLTNQVRGLVKSFGEKVPDCSVEAFPKVARAGLSRALKSKLGGLISAQEHLSRQIKAYDKKIAKLSSSKKYAEPTQKIRQIKGVGPITALAFVLTLGDPRRFAKSRDVGPYFGLVPKHDKSGQSDKQLSITKAGSSGMRRLLVTSANYVMGPFGEDCELRRHGERIAARGGKITRRKAKIAVARKLAVVMHQLLVSDAPYNPFHNTRGKAI